MLDKKLMKSALQEINDIRAELLSARDEVIPGHIHYQSLLNLKQYLVLRSKDRTALQEKLFLMSLSSLGRSYAHVAGSIDTLYDQIRSSLKEDELSEKEIAAVHHLSINKAIELASKNSTQLFSGKVSSKLSKQSTSIMVTLPSHAADDDCELIFNLAKRGVNVFRINTAHDSPPVWKAMSNVILKINEKRDHNNKLKIFVDLAGPKIRTGKIRRLNIPLNIGSNKCEKEVHIFCDEYMSTKTETLNERTQLKEPAHLCTDKYFFQKIKVNRPIKVLDANGKKAVINITYVDNTKAIGMIDKKVSVSTSTKLHRKGHVGTILNIDSQIEPIRLFRDDILTITEKDVLGRSARFDANGELLEPAIINCSFKGIATHIKIDDNVYIDDGKIGLKVIKTSKGTITCKVIQAKASGTLLKEEKGINFPNTKVKTAALTQTDRDNLLRVINFADHLSISFCQNTQDVRDLQDLLTENNRSDIGIIAKIETKEAVANMPKILEQLLAWEKSGVMIARGDLAIEVGFKNMAYIQEMLLDICDAAHMPVIWATQVLESQMKNNLPSRAEISDAAMAGRAECVMLNKGPFATDTIDVLIHILEDMHSIFKKNRQLLKKETLWSDNV